MSTRFVLSPGTQPAPRSGEDAAGLKSKPVLLRNFRTLRLPLTYIPHTSAAVALRGVPLCLRAIRCIAQLVNRLWLFSRTQPLAEQGGPRRVSMTRSP